MAETRAQERARGYQRPYERAGYATEYAYRTREARTAEERQYRAGQRGPAAFERTLESGRVIKVEIRGRYSEEIIGRTIDTRGRLRTFVLQRKPQTSAVSDRARARWQDMAEARGIDFDWSVSP